jgi:hypothetical protein
MPMWLDFFALSLPQYPSAGLVVPMPTVDSRGIGQQIGPHIGGPFPKNKKENFFLLSASPILAQDSDSVASVSERFYHYYKINFATNKWINILQISVEITKMYIMIKCFLL